MHVLTVKTTSVRRSRKPASAAVSTICLPSLCMNYSHWSAGFNRCSAPPPKERKDTVRRCGWVGTLRFSRSSPDSRLPYEDRCLQREPRRYPRVAPIAVRFGISALRITRFNYKQRLGSPFRSVGGSLASGLGLACCLHFLIVSIAIATIQSEHFCSDDGWTRA